MHFRTSQLSRKHGMDKETGHYHKHAGIGLWQMSTQGLVAGGATTFWDQDPHLPDCPFSDLGVGPPSLLHKDASLPGLWARHPLPLHGPRFQREALLQRYNIEKHWSFESGSRNPAPTNS